MPRTRKHDMALKALQNFVIIISDYHTTQEIEGISAESRFTASKKKLLEAD